MEGSVAYPPPSVCLDLVSGSFWTFGIPTLRGTFFERLMYELPESPQRMSWAITPDGKLHDYFIDQILGSLGRQFAYSLGLPHSHPPSLSFPSLRSPSRRSPSRHPPSPPPPSLSSADAESLWPWS